MLLLPLCIFFLAIWRLVGNEVLRVDVGAGGGGVVLVERGVLPPPLQPVTVGMHNSGVFVCFLVSPLLPTQNPVAEEIKFCKTQIRIILLESEAAQERSE